VIFGPWLNLPCGSFPSSTEALTEMAEDDCDRKVFINCPYSSDHQELLRAMIFVIFRLGFIPCIASQQSDSGELRMDKIKRFIRERTQFPGQTE